MNEERFAAETKKIQSVIAKASQKAGALSALSDGSKMSREKLQLTLEETAYSLSLRRSICAPSAKHRCRALADTGGATGWSSSSRPGTLKSRARAGYICSSIRSCRTAGICLRLG
jgi:hypothetical protein